MADLSQIGGGIFRASIIHELMPLSAAGYAQKRKQSAATWKFNGVYRKCVISAANQVGKFEFERLARMRVLLGSGFFILRPRFETPAGTLPELIARKIGKVDIITAFARRAGIKRV